jgi:hypothetical protein
MRNATLAGFGVVLVFPALACGTFRVNASPSEWTAPPLLEVRLVLAESAEEGFPVEFEREILTLAREPVISDPDFVAMGLPTSEGEAEQLAERVRTRWPEGL